MLPLDLAVHGPYRRRCRCLMCHPRHGWRRRVRLALLLLAVLLASFIALGPA